LRARSGQDRGGRFCATVLVDFDPVCPDQSAESLGPASRDFADLLSLVAAVDLGQHHVAFTGQAGDGDSR